MHEGLRPILAAIIVVLIHALDVVCKIIEQVVSGVREDQTHR